MTTPRQNRLQVAVFDSDAPPHSHPERRCGLQLSFGANRLLSIALNPVCPRLSFSIYKIIYLGNQKVGYTPRYRSDRRAEVESNSGMQNERVREHREFGQSLWGYLGGLTDLIFYRLLIIKVIY